MSLFFLLIRKNRGSHDPNRTHPPNPNHYVGNHPLIHSDQLDQYYPRTGG